MADWWLRQDEPETAGKRKRREKDWSRRLTTKPTREDEEMDDKMLLEALGISDEDEESSSEEIAVGASLGSNSPTKGDASAWDAHKHEANEFRVTEGDFICLGELLGWLLREDNTSRCLDLIQKVNHSQIELNFPSFGPDPPFFFYYFDSRLNRQLQRSLL